MKVYLVERYRPDIKFDKGGTIIALAPEACYHLNKAGVKYSIIEDYYDEKELSAGVDEYFTSQLEWIDSLDKFLQSNIKEIKELNLKLGTVYYQFLKTMVLDPLYIRCYTLNRLFAAIKPTSVILISPPPEEMAINFRLQSSGSSYYAQVIPLLCKANNIPLTPVFLEPDSEAMREIRSGRGTGELLTRWARALYQNTLVRRLHFAYKYFSRRHFLKQKRREGLNILLLKLVHIGMDFVIDATRRGHHVYQLADNLILKYSPLGAGKYASLGTEYRGKVANLKSDRIWADTAGLLEEHDLIKWINQKCQLDVTPIVLPRLRHFITEICPQLLAYFKVFTEFYEKARIDFVITPHESSPAEFAAIAAANHHNHTRSVCVQHGDSVFAANFWNIIELLHFNTHISSNKEINEYFRHQCQAHNIPTELYSGVSYRLSSIAEIGRLRESNKANIRKNRIIYLPAIMMWDTRKMGATNYPCAWYYEFQKSLMEYFSTRQEYTFVWKGLPVSDAIYNPIPNFIMDNDFSNIEIATNSFISHLLSADRVICDFPSTGFYESVAAGVPTMSLYHKAFAVRKSAVDYFGNLLKSYSDISEAIKYIDEFLHNDPESYKMTIEGKDESILHILEAIAEKREGQEAKQ